MKKSELKHMLKPLIKECIKEVMFEDGVLSGIISEVARGMAGVQAIPPQSTTIRETADPILERMKRNAFSNEQSKKLKRQKSQLMDAIGKEAYNGVNLFEGTAPLQHSQPQEGHADIGATNDAGVDISSLVANSSAIWQALK